MAADRTGVGGMMRGRASDGHRGEGGRAGRMDGRC
jgi:hypothetical protein